MSYLARLLQHQLQEKTDGYQRRHNRLLRPITPADIDRWQASAVACGIPDAPWIDFLLKYFPASCMDKLGNCHAPAPFHHLFWAWVWDLQRGLRPDALINCWFRGSAKSTFTEMVPIVVGARNVRSYVIYVCNTQAQADDHVQNIGAKLESDLLGRDFPDLASRKLGKYGHSLGWRRERLRTRSGLTVDALGLDTGRIRGLKIEDERPDLIIFDDVDDIKDGPGVTERNLAIIKKSIIPAGSDDAAVLVAQNKIREDGMMGLLVNGQADFLRRRVMNGPIPALSGFQYETQGDRDIIIAGEPTWEGRSIEKCQQLIDDEGISAFLEENQHETALVKGGLFDKVTYRYCDHTDMPKLANIVVWVDPAVTNMDSSDSQGIQASGLAEDFMTIVKLRSFEQRTSPEDALKRAILWAKDLNAEAVGVETDQGGDLWRGTYYRMCSDLGIPAPAFRAEKAGSTHQSKVQRVSMQLPDYETGKILHLRGTHHVLEGALNRFPKKKPFDLADADFWAWHDLCRFREVGGQVFEEVTWADLGAAY